MRRADLRRVLQRGHPAQLVVAVPLIVAAARAARNGWIPVGENAVISLRAGDVLTADHPWLGTASSVSVSSGSSANHPGPLLFDLLAVPVKLLGARWGLILGVLLIHLVAAQVAVLALRRIGGNAGAWFAGLSVLGLCWTLGPELMLDPWNPHVLLLPLLALLCAATAVAAGDARWAPWAVGLGSLVLQIHLSTLLVVPAVLLAAAWGGWARRRPGDRTPWLVALGVGVAAWLQPLWQQWFGPGPGNLSALAGSSGSGPRVGLGLGVRLVADVVAIPPFWLRPSFEQTLTDTRLFDDTGAPVATPGWLVGALPAVVVLLAVGGLLLTAGVRSRRHGHVAPASAALVAAAGLGAAVVSASLIPADGYGIAPHQLRFLWPLALWWPLAVAWAGWCAVRQRMAAPGTDGRAGQWARRSAPAVGAIVAALACVPSTPTGVGVMRATPSMADVGRVVDQVAVLAVPPVLLEEGGLWIGEPYTIPVLQALWENDQPVTVDASGAVQFGAGREVDTDPGRRLYLRAGAAALSCTPGVERLALVTPLSEDARIAFEALQREAIRLVAEEAEIPADRHLQDRVAGGEVDAVLADAGVDASQSLRELLASYEPARAALGSDTVAVFLASENGSHPNLTRAPEARCTP